MAEYVQVGKVGRSHGLDGSFVVEGASDAPERFAVGTTFRAGGQTVRIVAAKRAGGRVVIRLDQPVDRGTMLEISASELPPPEKDTYYVFQLVGLDVEEVGGRRLGRVLRVEPGVANDVLELDGGLALPLVAACVRGIDLAGGRIVVATGFGDPG